MKSVRVIIASLFLVALFSCSFKPIWDLEGKWKQVDGDQVIEFLKKGKIRIYTDSSVYEANYGFVDKDHFKVIFGDLGSIKVAFKVSGKELTITNQEGRSIKFRKLAGEKTVEKPEKAQKHETKSLKKETPEHEKKEEIKAEHAEEHHH